MKETVIIPDTKKYRSQLQEDYNSNKKVSLRRAFQCFRGMISSSRKTRDLLLEVAVSPDPKGPYKTWELELTFFHVVLKIGRLMFGKQFKGFVACHQIGTFTTYSVTIDGCEFWFDEFELAVASLYGGRAAFLNIDSAPIKQLEFIT